MSDELHKKKPLDPVTNDDDGGGDDGGEPIDPPGKPPKPIEPPK